MPPLLFIGFLSTFSGATVATIVEVREVTLPCGSRCQLTKVLCAALVARTGTKKKHLTENGGRHELRLDPSVARLHGGWG